MNNILRGNSETEKKIFQEEETIQAKMRGWEKVVETEVGKC